MSIGASPARYAPSETRVEVRVHGRWDALALCELLVPFHSFLVQLRADLWVVHARVPGCNGQSLSQALDVIDDWQAERRIAAAVRVSPLSHGIPVEPDGG